MAGFDPDAYLKKSNAPATTFDPDAYLGVKPQAAPMDFAPQPNYTPEQQAMIYGGNQDRGLGELALEGAGRALDYTGGVTRTGLASAFGEGGEDGQLLEAIQARPISGKQFLTQFGAENPSLAQGLLVETLVDPNIIFPVVKGATAAAKAAPKIAKGFLNQAYRPVVKKLSEKGIDLSDALLAQGFKGGSATTAKNFVESANTAAVAAREGISTAASQATAAPRALSKAEGVIAKAVKESTGPADRAAIEAMRAQLAEIASTPKSLDGLESIKRGLQRNITDINRAPGVSNTLSKQFLKGLSKDVDDEIIGRIAQSSPDAAETYAKLGKNMRADIKAAPLLQKLAAQGPLSAIDYTLLGAGGIGAATDNPELMLGLALKKAATNPYILSKTATQLVPRLVKPVGAATGAGVYGLLKGLTKPEGAQND